MKTKYNFSFSLNFIAVTAVIFSLIFSNCEKSITSNCPNKNVTCTIDGNAFQSCAITLVPYPTYIWIQAQPENTKSSIHLYIPKATGSYSLGYPSPYSGQYWDQSNPLKITSYLTDSTHIGSVTITKYDSINKMMSGVFYFNTKQYMPAGTGQKNVTSGVFTDVKW